MVCLNGHILSWGTAGYPGLHFAVSYAHSFFWGKVYILGACEHVIFNWYLVFYGFFLGGLCIYVHLGVVKVIMYVARQNFLGLGLELARL